MKTLQVLVALMANDNDYQIEQANSAAQAAIPRSADQTDKGRLAAPSWQAKCKLPKFPVM